jgi:HAD superfamily hydrolase (TIGR01509 family)
MAGIIKTLIFDFDGLILETEGPDLLAWQEIFLDHNVELTFDIWGKCIGSMDVFDPCEHLESLLGHPVDKEQINTRHYDRHLELVQDEDILPGVLSFLNDAGEISLKLGLASSSSSDWVLGHLGRLDLLEYFDAIRTKDDVGKTKPDPALFNLVLEDLNTPPDQAIILEDSPNGIMAAKKAGVFCVVVPNQLTAKLNLDGADIRLKSLDEISLNELVKITEAKISSGKKRK